MMVVFSYTIVIQVTTHREWGGGGGANREYMWKFLTILFSFNWKIQSAYPRWSHVQKEDNMSRCAVPENSSVAIIGWSVIWPDPMYKSMSSDWTGPTRPRTTIHDAHNEILVETKAAGELVPKWSGLHHS